MAALSDHPPPSSSSSASTYPRKRRRQTLLSAVAIVSWTIVLITCPTTSVHAAHNTVTTTKNNGGLRGPHHQQQLQQHYDGRGIPQHGQQSPRRRRSPLIEQQQHNRRRELLGEKGRTNPLESIYEENLKRKADNLRILQQQNAKKKKKQKQKQQQMVQNAGRFKKNQNSAGRLKPKKKQNSNNSSGGGRPGRNPNGNKRPKQGRPGGSSNNKMGRPNRPGRNPNNQKRPNKNKKPGMSNNGKPNRPWKPMRPNNGKLKKPGNKPGINNPDKNKPDKNNNIKPQSQQVNKPGKNKPGKNQNKPSKDKDDEIVDMSSSSAAANKPSKEDKPSKDKPQDYIVVKPGKDDIVNMASSAAAVDNIKPQANNNKPGKDKPGKDKPNKMSSFEIALAHMHITLDEYDKLSKNKQEEIKSLIDGKFNLGLMEMEEQSTSGAEGDDANGNADGTSSNEPVASSGQVIKLNWNFVPSLKDTSSLLDSFEQQSKLNWNMNDWNVNDLYASDGTMSISSGISNAINTNNDGEGEAVYSNLTLVTETNFKGGVLTFKILSSSSLSLPREAFWVEVDDEVLLPPDVTATSSSSSSKEWVEYSVPVNNGIHHVKWVHVYNPFSLPSLPPEEEGVGTLYMDELRYVSFTSSSNVEMTLGGKNGGNNDGASWWDVTKKDDSTIVATSSSMNGNRGSYTDVNFDLFTLHGGTLVYNVQTSTTAPHDDMTILINNDIVESIFGDMIGYERRELVVPKGKASIILRHRKNPGGLSSQVLRSLGVVGTEGKTWLKGLGFVVG